MELSCKSEYALLALIVLADYHPDGEPVQIRQIAAQQNIPDRYLEQLLASLRRSGLVRSQRGAKGGYLLTREPWQITLLEVINCIEGRDITAPIEELAETTERTAIREVWQRACSQMSAVFRDCTLQELCDRRDAKQPSQLMYYI
ncbi:HTH-type transcriptional regulator CymR [Acaryochloris thomasi RCC1774]|uniref:HTH-type transcriptional regulator CymR n=1 Tax=Acaryochloris thomasi RCC1774 TaxID=1764569 RepID=A0A2W1K4A7_9CYAN|nr:Rrf2 family transcriptional regulator [Acaryochloris thomasi]PZD74851.1 HTH-type transcriptional regulator CymR [Acaryochloris thomasi RCC1774]